MLNKLIFQIAIIFYVPFVFRIMGRNE